MLKIIGIDCIYMGELVLHPWQVFPEPKEGDCCVIQSAGYIFRNGAWAFATDGEIQQYDSMGYGYMQIY